MLEIFFNYVLMFFLFSMMGWAGEATYRSLGEQKIINTGFLFGPMCPIYGTGALVFEICLAPLKQYWWLVLILGMVLADFVEYFTSLIMEKLFNARWWDYTDEFMNLNGRICLKHTTYWGIASMVFVYFVSPLYEYFISFVPQNVRYIILAVIFVFFLVDLFLTVRAALGIQKIMRSMDSLKAKISLAADSVRITAENIRDDAEYRYDDLVTAIAGSTEKFVAWKNEMSSQFTDVKQKIEDLGKKDGKDGVEKRTKRFYVISNSLRTAVEKRMNDIEAKINEIKSKLDK